MSGGNAYAAARLLQRRGGAEEALRMLDECVAGGRGEHLEPARADACLPPPRSSAPAAVVGTGEEGGVPEGEVPSSRVGEGRITGVVVE